MMMSQAVPPIITYDCENFSKYFLNWSNPLTIFVVQLFVLVPIAPFHPCYP